MLHTSNKKSVSAVTQVRHSGFGLVRKRKRRGRLATMRDYARVNFEPWSRDADMHPDELIPSDKTLTRCGIPARLAYAIMLRTKNDLVDMFDKVELEHIDAMMTSLVDSAETLKAVVSILETAYLRVLVAGSASEINKSKIKGLEKRRRTLANRRAKRAR